MKTKLGLGGKQTARYQRKDFPELQTGGDSRYDIQTPSYLGSKKASNE